MILKFMQFPKPIMLLTGTFPSASNKLPKHPASISNLSRVSLLLLLSRFSRVRPCVTPQKNWCFWTVVLEKTLESPLDCKEIQPVHFKGNQSWIFIGRTDAEAETPILWPPDSKNWLKKRSWCGKDWRWEWKGTIEDEIVGWHHQFNGNEFE